MDYRDALYGLPEEEIQRRQEEEARAERWAAFVAWARQARPSVLLRHVGDLMDARSAPYYRSEAKDRLLAFSESEGWDGVLNAIARAMREEETYRRELVDRR